MVQLKCGVHSSRLNAKQDTMLSKTP